MSRVKAKLMDETAVQRAWLRVAHQISERNPQLDKLCPVGIRRRGIPLAKQLCQNLAQIAGFYPPCGELDIHFYRDDLTQAASDPVCKGAVLPFPVEGKTIILVDDVLYTGRTVRAAMEAVFSLGRPAAIQLAILIDRGHRELPFRADYVGKNIPTSHRESIAVRIPPYDPETGVYILEASAYRTDGNCTNGG